MAGKRIGLKSHKNASTHLRMDLESKGLLRKIGHVDYSEHTSTRQKVARVGIISTLILAAVVFSVSALRTKSANQKTYGRFIHFTDIHFDPFYRAGATVDSMCEVLPKDSQIMEPRDLAPVVGSHNCDTSPLLLDISVKHISKAVRNQPVDFILVTGDNSRYN
jgi:hypothetical protein